MIDGRGGKDRGWGGGTRERDRYSGREVGKITRILSGSGLELLSFSREAFY